MEESREELPKVAKVQLELFLEALNMGMITDRFFLSAGATILYTIFVRRCAN
jgi:hypothetical protein